MDSQESMARSRPPRRELRQNLVLLLAVCVVLFGAFEVLVRIAGRFSVDGQFFFSGRAIKPYALPAKFLAKKIREFDDSPVKYIVPDDMTGWGINPSSAHTNGLYRSNVNGMRADTDFTLEKPAGVRRIALFGDSFVHGDDVANSETWAAHLQTLLDERGSAVQVLNFGVGGCGNDQAYLLWKHAGRRYSPDAVVIGFQTENCRRNPNVVRVFLQRQSNIPFSKPRFLLRQGTLQLVNSPTIDYHELPEEVAAFDRSPLRAFEHYYNPDDYQGSFLSDHLKAVMVIRSLLSAVHEQATYKDFYDIESGEMQLCLALFDAFVSEASRESEVVIVHLPQQGDVETLLEGKDLDYRDMLDELSARHTLIDPAPALVAEARRAGISTIFKGHYSVAGNAIVADLVYRALR
jgi:hypothetical protein